MSGLKKMNPDLKVLYFQEIIPLFLLDFSLALWLTAHRSI